MAPHHVETNKLCPCGGVLEVEGLKIETAEPKQPSQTKVTSKSLELSINELDHSGGAIVYRFIHFEEPSVVLSSPAESLLLPSPSLPSAPPSPASISTSPLSSAKDHHDADDVWLFYLEEGDCWVCKLCQISNKYKNTKKNTYSINTGTTSLHHYLIREHLKLLNTLIKSNGTKAAEKFRKANGMATPSDTSCSNISSVLKFSHDAFINVIVEWIIANDQVIETWERYISTLKREMETLLGIIVFLVTMRVKILLLPFSTSLIVLALQLSWIMMDNAANNGTFIVFLEFYFCVIEKRIRCFAYIMNLAAKVVISAVTALNTVLLEESMNITQDPVATVRALFFIHSQDT
ncbi:hypothetical protein ARMGADRAFT_1025206 [Armillaria gallica]|uniref:Uncharacterized protein n=1 Tax=Armillaria gallica TaxID=47427 RepID=A0A2H3ED08_ARMGA|nr:hypothetical protein ARMGADRAFT_1025206 [Armillaria gallica]